MNRTFWGLLALLLSYTGFASAATLLPNGKQTFIDANGKPLAMGTVTMYVPGTTTAKTTWQDAAQTISNANPIALDVNGSALIYGAGCYRQIVKDSLANTIWDQPTCDTSSTNLIWAGHSLGTANSQTLTASNFSSLDGQTIAFIAGANLTNTGALTLTVNGGSPINVLRDTTSGPFSLAGGEVVAGNNVLVQYDAGRGAFHLVSNPVSGSTPASALSSSGTTDLGSAASRFVTIAGTATITSFGSSASLSFPLYTLIFGGASTLVPSAALILPGNANIVTAVNDTAIAAYSGAGNWKVLAYFKATGATVVPPPSFANILACPWTVPTSGGNLPVRVDFQVAGGGGGGGGSGTSDGGAGGATTFNAITANGGGGGTHSANNFGTDGGAGGTGGAGSATLRLAGSSGGGGVPSEGGAGGTGAAGGLGGIGGHSPASWSVAGSSSPANTAARMNAGLGGGGGGWTSGAIGQGGSSGGGGGEYIEGTVATPGATIACTLGAAGTTGTAAGAGGVGAIMTRSYWQ